VRRSRSMSPPPKKTRISRFGDRWHVRQLRRTPGRLDCKCTQLACLNPRQCCSDRLHEHVNLTARQVVQGGTESFRGNMLSFEASDLWQVFRGLSNHSSARTEPGTNRYLAGAMSIPGSAHRLDPSRLQNLVRPLLSKASQNSCELGQSKFSDAHSHTFWHP